MVEMNIFAEQHGADGSQPFRSAYVCSPVAAGFRRSC
jgi:hypothetical protein